MCIRRQKIRATLALTVLLLSSAGCGEAVEEPTPPEQVEEEEGDEGVDQDKIESELPQLLEDADVSPLEKPAQRDPAKVELGRMLFFDPILSGNKDTNCAVCHHPENATTTPGSLAVGTKPNIVDGVRLPGNDHTFTPRNSPDLFNLGDPQLETIFWDSRMVRLETGEIVMHDRTSAKALGNYLRVMPDKVDNLPAAQAMFPVAARDEMRGDYGEKDINGDWNELASRTDLDFEGVWRDLVERLLEIDEYRQMFEEVYPDISEDEITFHLAANAMSAFMIETFTFTDAPFDEYLRGDEEALSDQQKHGAWLFYGEAGCADCHSGRLMTDQDIHNIGVRPISAGRDIDSDFKVDMGASHHAHAGTDEAFSFRTPTLRNVELTAPYMHNGAYMDLESVIRHKTDLHHGLWDYNYMQLEEQFWDQVHKTDEAMVRVESTMDMDDESPELTDEEIDALVAFLESLTSPSAEQMTGIEPQEVPSGLPIPEP